MKSSSKLPKCPKRKAHQFILTVESTDSKESAYWSIMCALAQRKPDCMTFMSLKGIRRKSVRPTTKQGGGK